jgi:menaquinone-dependent protoporphyrinogen oxidase
MSNKVLVGYATRSGSTREVAEAVAATLRENGIEADLQPVKSVVSLVDYQAVVLGAPLYMFRLHKDARAFLGRNRKALAELPVAVFALGPFNDVEKEWQSVRDNLAKELAKYAWLTPIDTAVFGGVFNPAKLGFPYNLFPPLKKMPPSDIRDWTAIRSWAASLAPKL